MKTHAGWPPFFKKQKTILLTKESVQELMAPINAIDYIVFLGFYSMKISQAGNYISLLFQQSLAQ